MSPDRPSPAQDALQKTLTLHKKSSWFGSIKRTGQRVALQAKATVDSLRSRSDELEEDVELRRRPGTDTPVPTKGFLHRRSDSRASTTTLRQSLLHKRSDSVTSTITDRTPQARPKTAMVSLRQRMSFRSTHNRRDSGLGGFERLLGRPSLDQLRAAGAPEQFVGPRDEEDTATEVPLPTSPINIMPKPSPLRLDLGPPAMNPALFECFDTSPGKAIKDPAMIATGVPVAHREPPPPFHFPSNKSLERLTIPTQPLSPTEERTIDPFNDPPSPMPGAGLPLELDGANDERGRSVHRGVSGADSVNSMRTLDAGDAPQLQLMEPLCRVEKHDKLLSSFVRSSMRRDSAQPQNEDLKSESISPFNLTSRDGGPSEGTRECAQDSEKPQLVVNYRLGQPKASSKDHNAFYGAVIRVWPSRLDVVQDEASVTTPLDTAPVTPPSAGSETELAHAGPPSPVRSVTLPFRPKPADSLFSDEAAELRSTFDGLAAEMDIKLRSIRLDSDRTLRKKTSTTKPNIGIASNNPFALLFPEPNGDSSSSASSSDQEPNASTNVLWRRTVSYWMNPESVSPVKSLATPARPSIDSSTESVYGSSPVRTPSMGDRLQFEATRSQRNMRYNALHQASSRPAATPTSLMSSTNTSYEGFQLPDGPGSTPQKVSRHSGVLDGALRVAEAVAELPRLAGLVNSCEEELVRSNQG